MINKLAPAIQSTPQAHRAYIKLVGLVVFLTFITLSDAILSYWVPGFIQDSVGSSTIMGLIMAFSSVVGLVADLTLPQILKGIRLKSIYTATILASLAFIGLLAIAIKFPLVLIFLAAVGVWGLYYELLGFANVEYVATNATSTDRSRVWGVISTFKSFAYFISPLLVTGVLIQDPRLLLSLTAFLTILSFSIIAILRWRERHTPAEPHEIHHINLITEIKRWKTLLPRIWPVVLLSTTIGFVDAVFWTTGVVWSQNVAESTPLGGLIVSAYALPTIFAGLIIARLGIAQHKKKTAELMLLIGSVFLIFIGFITQLPVIIISIAVGSLLFSMAIPLVDAVYTDVIVRMGKQQQHLIGLSNATYSLAYIIGPIVGGICAGVFGEQQAFTVVGIITAITAVWLLIATPRKIHLPQLEIRHWK